MVFSSSMRNNNLNRAKQPNLTPWDLFVCVAGRPEGIALTRLAHVLQVERERTLIRPLGSLAEQELIIDEGDRYSLANTKRAQNLKATLDYALAYNYDYNAFLEPDMIDFLTNAYRHEYFTQYDMKKESLYPDVLGRLIRNKLLIVYTFKPFMGKLVQNPFLDGLCEFLSLRKNKSFFSGLFRKKMPLERVIKEKLSHIDDDPQIEFAKNLLGDEVLRKDYWQLPDNIKALQESVMREDTEVFDQSSTDCYKKAWEQMHANIAAGKRLTIDVVRQYHSIAMATTNLGGKIRDFEVIIRNNPHFKTAPFTKVEELLNKLLSDIGTIHYEEIDDQLDMASYAYNQFIYIHPFEDGNSRLARIILGHLLNENKLPFEEIPSSYEVRFLQATKGYRKRDDDVLKEMLEEIYISHLNMGELDKALKLEVASPTPTKSRVMEKYGSYGSAVRKAELKRGSTTMPKRVPKSELESEPTLEETPAVTDD